MRWIRMLALVFVALTLQIAAQSQVVEDTAKLQGAELNQHIGNLIDTLGPFGMTCGGLTNPAAWDACEGLTTIGKPAVPTLCTALRDADIWHRTLSAEILGRIGDR